MYEADQLLSLTGNEAATGEVSRASRLKFFLVEESKSFHRYMEYILGGNTTSQSDNDATFSDTQEAKRKNQPVKTIILNFAILSTLPFIKSYYRAVVTLSTITITVFKLVGFGSPIEAFGMLWGIVTISALLVISLFVAPAFFATDLVEYQHFYHSFEEMKKDLRKLSKSMLPTPTCKLPASCQTLLSDLQDDARTLYAGVSLYHTIRLTYQLTKNIANVSKLPLKYTLRLFSYCIRIFGSFADAFIGFSIINNLFGWSTVGYIISAPVVFYVFFETLIADSSSVNKGLLYIYQCFSSPISDVYNVADLTAYAPIFEKVVRTLKNKDFTKKALLDILNEIRTRAYKPIHNFLAGIIKLFISTFASAFLTIWLIPLIFQESLSAIHEYHIALLPSFFFVITAVFTVWIVGALNTKPSVTKLFDIIFEKFKYNQTGTPKKSIRDEIKHYWTKKLSAIDTCIFACNCAGVVLSTALYTAAIFLGLQHISQNIIHLPLSFIIPAIGIGFIFTLLYFSLRGISSTVALVKLRIDYNIETQLVLKSMSNSLLRLQTPILNCSSSYILSRLNTLTKKEHQKHPVQIAVVSQDLRTPSALLDTIDNSLSKENKDPHYRGASSDFRTLDCLLCPTNTNFRAGKMHLMFKLDDKGIDLFFYLHLEDLRSTSSFGAETKAILICYDSENSNSLDPILEKLKEYQTARNFHSRFVLVDISKKYDGVAIVEELPTLNAIRVHCNIETEEHVGKLIKILRQEPEHKTEASPPTPVDDSAATEASYAPPPNNNSMTQRSENSGDEGMSPGAAISI